MRYSVISVLLSTLIKFKTTSVSWSRDSAVGIANGNGLDNRGVGVRIPVRQEFSLLHVVQTGSGVYPVSYPVLTGGSFPEGKAAEE
jgi:hypothetical protein